MVQKIDIATGVPIVPIEVTGSNAYLSYQLSIGASVQIINFGAQMNSSMVTNDGTSDVKIGFQGKNPLGTINDNLDTTWTFTGNWITDTHYVIGTNSVQSSTVGNTAVYKPTISCSQITYSYYGGASGGIAKIELSNDGGVTWQNPSTISVGVLRSDGVTGTGFDTFDTYSTVTGGADITYTVPYGTWAMRITVTGNKNASSTGTYIWVDGGKAGLGAIVVKAGETQTYPIRTSDIQMVSTSGTQSVRLVVTN